MDTPKHTHQIARARGLLREVLDLAEIQGWKVRPKADGFLFFPPREIARPGMDHVYADDPGGDSTAQQRIRDRLRKAGLQFPEDRFSARRDPMSVPRTNGMNGTADHGLSRRPTDAPNPFTLARQKISAVISLLSELEQLLQEAEVGTREDSAKMQNLRDLLKNL